MVFFYISKYVTKWIGPPLFRNGLRLRNRLTQTPTPGVGIASTNNYWMDMACMIPYSQKLLSLAVYDESKRLALEFRKQHQKEQEQEQSTVVDDKVAMNTDPAANLRISKMRVKVLDEYLRPSLMPNNLWSDIEQNWRYHLRIVAWARKEFLISKYGPYIQEAMVAYPQLRNSPQLSVSFGAGGSGNKRQILLDLVHRGVINTDNIVGGPAASNKKNAASPFLQLPPSDIILNAFRMKGWSNDKSTERYVHPWVFLLDDQKFVMKSKHETRRPASLQCIAHGYPFRLPSFIPQNWAEFGPYCQQSWGLYHSATSTIVERNQRTNKARRSTR